MQQPAQSTGGSAPQGAAAAAIRRCVHCGFCLATCPTYVLGGNELDSPRGRIQLVKEMIETSAVPSARVVRHVDRCLSCLACESTCPSGVSYRRVIDEARAYIAAHYRRPLLDRWTRAMLAHVLPYPRRFRLALWLAWLARPLAGALRRSRALQPLAAMLQSSRRPARLRAEGAGRPGMAPARGRARVGLWLGCVEPVLEPAILESARRLLERAGLEVVQLANASCCGALSYHMGRESQSLESVRANVDAWSRELESGPLEGIVVTASGCGSMLRDYGHLLRDDSGYAARAGRIAALACDITQLLARFPVPARPGRRGIVVAYHSACSLRHGQKVVDAPVRLLEGAGFDVRQPAEAHLCCGSAGTYNILQPQISGALAARKAGHLQALDPDVIATGNIGCLVQIGNASAVPVLHVAQLLDWASGGPVPRGLEQAVARAAGAGPATGPRTARPGRASR